MDNKLVKYYQPTSGKTGDVYLNKTISPEVRKEITCKLAVAFRKEIMNLSKENQEILLDDIITAFQNRIVVFNRTKLDYFKAEDNIEFQCNPMINHLEEQ